MPATRRIPPQHVFVMKGDARPSRRVPVTQHRNQANELVVYLRGPHFEGSSTKEEKMIRSALVAGIAVIATVPALATDSATDKQKQQYLYDQTMKNQGAAANNPAANSGPGVQGAPDTRTGPSTRAPGSN